MNRNYRMLSFVPRWGIAPRHHQQTVAEHSYYVVLYAAQLCDRMGIGDLGRLNVVEYALVHDVREAWESDIPGPSKRAIVDKERADRYHGAFAATMDPYYRGSYVLGVEVVVDGYGVGRLIKDIVKVADLIDSVFYLKQETLMGNAFAQGLFMRDMERLRAAAQGVLVRDLLDQFWIDIDTAMYELGNAGAVLPIVDTDLPGPPYLPGDGPEYPTWANPASGAALNPNARVVGDKKLEHTGWSG